MYDKIGMTYDSNIKCGLVSNEMETPGDLNIGNFNNVNVSRIKYQMFNFTSGRK